MKFSISFIAVFAIIIFACSTQKAGKNDLMVKAHDIHLESLKIEKEIAPKIEALTNLKNNINIQGRALTPEEMSLVDRIEHIEAAYDYWRKNLPEVPGFGHDGHEHAGYNDQNGQPLELTPEDWVKVQTEFRDNILAIKANVEGVMYDNN